MRTFVTYRITDGELIDLSTNPPVIQGGNFSSLFFDADFEYNLTEYDWDKTGLTFIPKTNVTPRILTRLQFLEKFTIQERIAIREAAKTNPIVFDILELLNLATDIDLDNPTCIQSIQYFYSVGLLSSQRVTEILG